ncbi:MAG: hypothetical protein EBV86_15545 [Marivivens sp.]|nr:hypothetical protein [Marivivens sp.]
MEIMSKEIALVDIESIIPNPKNPNKHSEKQIERLTKIFRHQGFREPLTISNQSGFLVCGHGRLEAAKILGVEELPVMFQNFENEAKEFAHMVADNEIARWTEFDKVTFEENFSEEIDQDLFGLKAFNFNFEEGKTNPNDEWVEMPEFENEDIKNFKSVIVHFKTEQDYKNFSVVVDQKLTNETKSIYYPKQIKEKVKVAYES